MKYGYNDYSWNGEGLFSASAMEQFEMMGDLLDDLQEWLDFEADTAEGNPWG